MADNEFNGNNEFNEFNRVYGITCNCGGAKQTVEAKLQVIYHQMFKEKHGEATAENQPPLTPFWTHIRIRDLTNKPEHAGVQELAKQAGLWDYLKRPNAGSDKVILLPEINSWIDARMDYLVLKEIKPKELEYLYSIGKKI